MLVAQLDRTRHGAEVVIVVERCRHLRAVQQWPRIEGPGALPFGHHSRAVTVREEPHEVIVGRSAHDHRLRITDLFLSCLSARPRTETDDEGHQEGQVRHALPTHG